MPRRRSIPGTRMHSAAGSWSASRSGVLLRPPSPPISAYQGVVQVPIGNDGIAFPNLFTGAGTAQDFTGPSGVGTSWDLTQASIYTSVGPNDAAIATLFVGPLPISQYQVASFLAGGGSQVPLAGYQLTPGWFVWCLWTGGTPGATASLTVAGTKRALVI